jgi:acyl-CoA synthetase (AMP-forming)/AMP-acid ligase II
MAHRLHPRGLSAGPDRGFQASATQAAGLTVGTLFHHQAVRNGGRTALESDGRSLTYAQLGERVNRLAHAFAAKGVGRGDRIAVLSENRLEYPELQLAAARLGAILACQNWRQSGPELQHCVSLVAPRLAVVSERHADRLAAIDHGVPETVTLGDEYEALLKAASAEPRPDVARPEDGLVILYTSGTTGLPKAAGGLDAS